MMTNSQLKNLLEEEIALKNAKCERKLVKKSLPNKNLKKLRRKHPKNEVDMRFMRRNFTDRTIL